MNKNVITALKIGISVAIIAWLFHQALNDTACQSPGCDFVAKSRNDAEKHTRSTGHAVFKNVFGDLKQQFHDPGFQWWAIGGAFAAFFTSVLLTLVRWCYLVRALGMELSMREALRIGFMGYLFNLAPMGIVGGDLLKAVMLARHYPTRRAQSLATVAVDRVIGLYILFIVASTAILLTGFWWHADKDIRFISLGALAVTLGATLGLAVLFIPGLTGGALTGKIRGSSRIGQQIANLIDAVRMYRDNRGVLLLSSLLTIGVHSLFAVGIYLVTVGIYQGKVGTLSLASEFVVAPLSAATAVIPLAMGPMEVVLNYLYATLFELNKQQGFVVALGYRLVTLLVAMVGVCYYLGARGEVSRLMTDAEGETPDDAKPAEPVLAKRCRTNCTV